MIMNKYFDFKNQVALITGCSTGLGVQMAQALASCGANIVAVARRKNLVEEVAEKIKNDYNVETLALTCDVTDTENVEQVVKAAVDKFSKIDILINNAGIGASAKAESMTDKEFYDDINTDLFGVYRVAREVAKVSMIHQNYGRVINIASMYGLVGNKIDPCVSYHTAKGGVVNMTRALAAEWGKYNITVNSICPGFFYSELTKDLLDSKSFQDNAKVMIPLERYGNPGELDTAVLFLASKLSTYVTGVNLPVDGGYTCM